jgi:hypothetical protein
MTDFFPHFPPGQEPDDDPPPPAPTPLPPWLTRTIIGTLAAIAGLCAYGTGGWIRIMAIAVAVLLIFIAFAPALRSPGNQ